MTASTPGALDGREHGGGLGEIGRERLLDHHRELALERGHDGIDVQMLVGRHHDRGHFRLLQELAEIRRHEIRADLVGDELRAVRIDFGDADPVDLRMARGELAADEAHPPRADDGQADAFGLLLHAAARRDSGKRQIHGLVALGGDVGGDIHLHDLARLLRCDEDRPVKRNRFEEVDGLALHRTGIRVVHELAGHGRHRQAHAVLHRVEHHVAVTVVHDDRAFRADHLDPRRREVRIPRRQAPAAADHEGQAAVHRDRDPLVVRDVAAGRFLECAVVDLRVDAHGLRGLQAPQDKIEVVRRFHRGGRKLGAAADLLAEAAGDVAAHQRAHRTAERAVLDAALDVGVLGIEALRITDREFELPPAGDGNQVVGFVQLHRDRLFEEHVLARKQALARDGVVGGLGRGRNQDGVDGGDFQQIAIVGRRRARIRLLRDFREPLGPRFRDVQLVDEGIGRARLGADAAAPAGADDGRR